MDDVVRFHTELMNEAETRATIDQTWFASALLDVFSERLSEAGEIESLHTLVFEGEGVRRRRLAVHGFDLDDADNSIALAVLDFDTPDAHRRVTHAQALSRLKHLENYLTECVTGQFQAGREPSYPEYQLAEDLRRRGGNVSRYRLYLLSDAELRPSSRIIPSSEINGIPVDYHVWDISRFRKLAESQSGREELGIDLTRWVPQGVPALEVSDSSSALRTYLAAVPANLLVELYGLHGSRLLESNVRSYLSNRGKVNKGIRATVVGEPSHFLAFNNGITATATGAVFRHGRLISVTDLQIVNGGQTTASLFFVSRDSKSEVVENLEDVYVQMKLVCVSAAESAHLVPSISRYANSQNRVSEVDFFSNSPFHIRLAELSQRILAPAKAGVSFQTKWFYERTRGSYQNQKAVLSTAEQRRFEAEYPKGQVIDKSQAAKYEVTWDMRPHLVSAGAQKNFVAYADLVAKKWSASPEIFNEEYWKDLVAKRIIFEEVRSAIARSSWYEKGYLANYVTYTLAKFAYEIGQQKPGGAFDFRAVWNSQETPDFVIAECLRIGEGVQAVLNSDDRPVQNVTEWAKREDCWNLVRAMPHILSASVLGASNTDSEVRSRARSAAADQRLDDGIDMQVRVLSMQVSEWMSLQMFGRSHRLLTEKENSIIRILISGGVPSEAQSRVLVQFIKKCAEAGYRG